MNTSLRRSATESITYGTSRCADCSATVQGLCDRLRAGGQGDASGHIRYVDMPAGKTLIAEHTRPSHVWVVRSGILRVQQYSMDGHRHIMCLVLPGEVVGDDPAGHGGYSVEASTDCSLCSIDRRVFDGLIKDDAELRRTIYLQKLDQLDRVRWLIWSLGVLSREERICAFLAYATRIMPFEPLACGVNSGVLTLSLPRPDIADLLGTTVELISRIARRLHETGVIRIRDSEHFEIPDLHRLIRKGCVEQSFGYLPAGRKTPAVRKAEVPASDTMMRRGFPRARPARILNDPRRRVH